MIELHPQEDKQLLRLDLQAEMAVAVGLDPFLEKRSKVWPLWTRRQLSPMVPP